MIFSNEYPKKKKSPPPPDHAGSLCLHLFNIKCVHYLRKFSNSGHSVIINIYENFLILTRAGKTVASMKNNEDQQICRNLF